MGRTAVFCLLLSACAASRTNRFLAEHTEGHVFAKPIAEVWPAAKAVLEERGFLPAETGEPYRIQTAAMMPDGTLPSSQSSSNAAMDTGRGATGRGAQRHSGAVAPSRSTGEVWRFTVNGTVVDGGHCRVRFLRIVRDSFDAPESLPEVDAELEWALISRVEPDAAAAIRKDAQAAGVTLEPSSQTSTDMFSKAEAYERFMGRWSAALAAPLIRFSGMRPNDAVLDVGSGTGALSFAAAATSSGPITGIDPSSDYVAFANQHAPSARVRFEVGDAQSLRFPDGGFDQTLALLVINFIPDAPKALREMKRVTRPGGVVSAAVWDYAEGMQMLRVFWDEVVALDPASASRDEATMPLSRSGQLAALWREQGLVDVQEQPIIIRLHFKSFDDFWAPFLLGQGPAGSYVASLPGDRRSALEQRLRARLLGTGPDHPIELEARAWAVRGTVP